jgi:hypothetical protein
MAEEQNVALKGLQKKVRRLYVEDGARVAGVLVLG